jgi:excisionase family DNA binding protein
MSRSLRLESIARDEMDARPTLAPPPDDSPTNKHRKPQVAASPPEGGLPPILCVEEFARLLRVNRKTAYEAVANGQVPGVRRLGRTIRIDRDAVLEWLRGQGCVSPSSRRQR